MEMNKIYNQDCLEGMKDIPDNYFDLIITDPPYGIGMSPNFLGLKKRKSAKAPPKDYGEYEWDNSIPSAKCFKEILRVSKHQIIFGGNYFTQYLFPSSCWIVWDKDNGDNDFADCELAWTSFNTAVRKFKHRWNGMLQEQMNWKEKRLHPTQKPIALGRWLLKNYAKEGDKIFDPFAGSGSFLVACKQLGFEYVGCEIDKEYMEIAQERLSQRVLFPLDTKQEGGKGIPPTNKLVGKMTLGIEGSLLNIYKKEYWQEFVESLILHSIDISKYFGIRNKFKTNNKHEVMYQ